MTTQRAENEGRQTPNLGTEELSTEGQTVDRRTVIMAGVIAGGAPLLGACSSDSDSDKGTTSESTASTVKGGELKKPNFVIILADQMRTPGMHWPPGFADEHMPSLNRLREHGVTFKNAHIAAAMCSPSRAALWTGTYENVNGVQTVVSQVPGAQLRPASEVPNIATMLKAAGYDVVYKGKWDGTQPWEATQEQTGDVDQLPQQMEETYGFAGWNPPDSGITLGYPLDQTPSAFSLSTLGGAKPANDSRYVRGEDPDKVCADASDRGTGCQTPGTGKSILDHLKLLGQTPPGDRRPFCLIVSLCNPHDIGFYPNGYDQPGVGYPENTDLGIDLPDNFDDPLTTKPTIQTTYRQTLSVPDLTDEQQLGYVNFYADLNARVDKSTMAVLDAIDDNGLTDDTIIIRTADHGELGLSHGLVEKCYTAYREAVNVPLVFSNPVMFPEPKETDAIWSHVDLTATVGELAGAKPIGVGKSQVTVLQDPKGSVRESAVFSCDDALGLPYTTPASHNRALIDQRYTYAVYFTASYAGTLGNSALSATAPYQVELYDHEEDIEEMNNLLWEPSDAIEPLWEELHGRLTADMQEMGSIPPGWPATLADLKAGIQQEITQ